MKTLPTKHVTLATILVKLVQLAMPLTTAQHALLPQIEMISLQPLKPVLAPPDSTTVE